MNDIIMTTGEADNKQRQKAGESYSGNKTDIAGQEQKKTMLSHAPDAHNATNKDDPEKMKPRMPEGDIAHPLAAWFENVKRDLPWRRTKDAYRIWVSEIMLQQTTISAVIGYYERFLTALPTLKDLAACPDDRLLKLWEGLGYYSRVRNMKKAAIQLVEQGLDNLPADHKALLDMPGVGAYTAGAIGSLAFGLRYPAVDGNVLRVMTRLTASYADNLKPAVKSYYEKEMKSLLDGCPDVDSGVFNEAIMELGETVCLPHGEVLCEECPLKHLCLTKAQGLQSELPVRVIKTKRRIEKKTIFLWEHEGRFAVRKRPETGLLSGLYEFPNTEGHLTEEAAVDFVEKMGGSVIAAERLKAGKHLFSHIEWQMIGYRVHVSKRPTGEDLCWATREEIFGKYAVPGAFDTYRKLIPDDKQRIGSGTD
ncbi:MAG: A/G-specific adenine glycosylase [Lachnospiraceae bacterium]|nr:A/G-specific adenine glycosylase [Lachnospiraceae bacterium]